MTLASILTADAAKKLGDNWGPPYSPLVRCDPPEMFFTKLLKPFFTKYDTDKSGKIEMVELNRVFSELGEPKSQTELDGIFADIDKDKSESIELAEFVEKNGPT